VSVPLPLPVAELVSVTHPGAPVTFQAHPGGAVITTLPFPPAGVKACPLAFRP